jgi:hypothetical protein
MDAFYTVLNSLKFLLSPLVDSCSNDASFEEKNVPQESREDQAGPRVKRKGRKAEFKGVPFMSSASQLGHPTEVADQVVQMSDSNGCGPALCGELALIHAHSSTRAHMHAHANTRTQRLSPTPCITHSPCDFSGVHHKTRSNTWHLTSVGT